MTKVDYEKLRKLTTHRSGDLMVPEKVKSYLEELGFAYTDLGVGLIWTLKIGETSTFEGVQIRPISSLDFSGYQVSTLIHKSHTSIKQFGLLADAIWEALRRAKVKLEVPNNVKKIYVIPHRPSQGPHEGDTLNGLVYRLYWVKDDYGLYGCGAFFEDKIRTVYPRNWSWGNGALKVKDILELDAIMTHVAGDKYAKVPGHLG